MKALVTGGGGFLGRAIVEMLLNRGDQVRIFARQKYPQVEAYGAEGMQGDVRSLDDLVNACRGMDVVFHTAALPGIWGDPEVFHGINVKGTENVIGACKRCGVGKLIYTSSPSVVFDMKDECGIDERTPYPEIWFNPYSQTKAQAEQIVLKASGHDGLLSCSIRPHLLWGPRDNQLLPRLIDRARRRRLSIIGKGENKVDLTYIENAAMAHLLACDAMTSKRVSGQAYFISDDNPVILWDWINALLEKLEIKKIRRHIPVRLAYGLGYCFEGLYHLIGKYDEPLMTRFLAKALSCSHYYDISKAKRDFGYRAIVDNDEGVRRTVEYLKKASVSRSS